MRPAAFDGLTGLQTFLSQYRTVNSEDLVALQGADKEEAEDILFELEADGRLKEDEPGEFALKEE